MRDTTHIINISRGWCEENENNQKKVKQKKNNILRAMVGPRA